MNPVIKTSNLSYRYSKTAQTLFDINLHVKKGTIYGFLGPNGSGKTTTLSLLLGLLNNQQGNIEIFGKNMLHHRIDILRKIGSLIEIPSLYGHLTATENLEVYRPIYKASRERAKEILKIVGLDEAGNKIAKKFSLGMKQRLAIALALLPNPELLILDEPTNGLDPNGIIELRQLIKDLNINYGMTILISSHILSEVEKIVNDVGIIYKGKMLFQGSLAELHSFQHNDSKLMVKTSDNNIALGVLERFQPEVDGDTILLPYKDMHEVAMINRHLTQHDLDVYLLNPRQNDLEQLFINLTSNH